MNQHTEIACKRKHGIRSTRDDKVCDFWRWTDSPVRNRKNYEFAYESI